MNKKKLMKFSIVGVVIGVVIIILMNIIINSVDPSNVDQRTGDTTISTFGGVTLTANPNDIQTGMIAGGVIIFVSVIGIVIAKSMKDEK